MEDEAAAGGSLAISPAFLKRSSFLKFVGT